MLELRALGLVHRQRERRLHGLQALRDHPAHMPVRRNEGDPQGRFRRIVRARFGIAPGQPGGHAQGHADVAVDQPQRVVVACDDHRAALVPGTLRLQYTTRRQRPGNAPVHPVHAPGALTHGAQQLEAPVLAQGAARPFLPRAARIAGCRASGRQMLQIADHPERCGVGMSGPVQHPPQQVRIVRALQHRRVDILARVARHLGRAVIHRGGQAADPAVRAEASAAPQHRHMLVQCASVLVHIAGRQLQPGYLAQPGGRLRRVMPAVGPRAQLAQHRPGLHRGELVAIAQQHQPRMGRHRGHQAGHQLQIHHRGLVHHQHIHRQRIARIVAEAPGIGPRTQQAVQRDDLARDRGAQALATGEAFQPQRVHRSRDRGVQPCGGLAGRRRQADAQRLALALQAL